MDSFTKSINLFGSKVDSASPLRHLSVCFGQLGEFQKAKLNLNRAIKIEPKSPFNYLVKGLINILEGEFYEAIKNIEKAVKKSNYIAEFRIYNFIPYLFIGEENKAIELLKESLSQIRDPLIRLELLSFLKSLKDKMPRVEGLDSSIKMLNDS